jgi:4-amino-4-deoxy-L-arabinose transferase-like glycosyltransferase
MATKPAYVVQMDRNVLWRGALLLLLLLAFSLRLSGLTLQSLWRDEVDALLFSQKPLREMIGNFSRPGWNGPLYYVLLRVWVALTGTGEFSLRYLSLLSGVLGVALLYRLGREWFTRPVGYAAALMMACAPYMVWYGQEVKMYALLPTLALAVLWLYGQALAGRDWRLWPIIVALTWTLIGVHVLGILIVPVMGALLLVWWPAARRQWCPALVAMAGCLLPALIALPWALPLLRRGGSIGHRPTSLPAMAVTMVYAFGRGITVAGGLWPIGLALFMLLTGTFLWPGSSLLDRVWGTLRRGHSRVGSGSFVAAAWAWLLVPLLGLYLVSTRVPMFVDRYLIWIGPPFFLLLARGVDQLRRRSVVLASVCLAGLLTLNAVAIWQQSAQPIKSDFRAAASYLRQHRRPDELAMFHISYIRDTFEYYGGDASPAVQGIPTNDQTTPEEVDASMREQIGGHRVVWLILSEPEMWDPRGMTVAWLNEQGQATARADFARVSVVRYALSP